MEIALAAPDSNEKRNIDLYKNKDISSTKYKNITLQHFC